MGHRLDVGPGAARRHRRAQGIAVIGPVGEQDLAFANAGQQVGRAASVMGLPLAQLERDRVAVGSDDGMDLGGQSAARTPHACGRSEVPGGGRRRPPFLTLAAC